uniref:Endonuclease/exonuclease/phosphatase domain-containing protein n=1 Tax=Papio anubis TaxID=9555 RepID=A0A8I5N664_PAPAN
MKKKMLRAAREKGRVTDKGKPIRPTADLSAETPQARREWGPIFNILKEKNFQPRISYPAKISFISEGEIQSFTDKQMLRFYHHQGCLTRAPEGSTKYGKEKPIPVTAKTHQIVKTINTTKKLHRLTGKMPASIIMTGSNSQKAILTLNVNRLNAPIKKHGLANWIKSQDPSVCYIQETHLMCKDTYRLKIKGWRKIYKANGKQKKAGIANLVSDKTNFKGKKIKKDKEGHYTMVKGSMQQEELTILNICAPNTGAPSFIKQVLRDLQRDLDSHTTIMRDFNTPLSILDRSTRQKINKDIQDLNSALEQVDLIDIYRTLHPKSTEYTFLSALHHTYSKTDHILGSKTLLSKCKQTEIITVSQTTVQSN